MIKISFVNGKKDIDIDKKTILHAVQYAVENGVKLSGAYLIGSSLQMANLQGANLCGADLRGADLSYANLTGASLRRADLSCANLTGASLTDADFTDSNLRMANLRGATMLGSDLSCANLTGANLQGANIREANLTKAHLYLANLTDANFDFACWPLFCGSLNVKIDKLIFCQLLYHALRAGQSVDDQEVKKLFEIPEMVNLANQFHRVDECGKIELKHRGVGNHHPDCYLRGVRFE